MATHLTRPDPTPAASAGREAAAVRIAGLAGAAGIAVVVLFGTIDRGGPVPWWTDHPARVASYFADARLDTAQALGMALQPLAWLVLAGFVVRLAAMLAAADGGWRMAEIVLALAGMLSAVFGIARLAPPLVMAFRGPRGGLDADDYVLLNDLDFALFWPALSLGGAVLGAAALAMLRTGVFPPWLAWAGLLVAPVVLLVAALPGADPPLLQWGYGLTFLWLAVVAVTMAVRPGAGRADQPA